MNPWQRTDVALAQRKLVLQQLDEEQTCPPFQAFRRAMDFLLSTEELLRVRGGGMLEVGCGVGHYGVLVERHYPTLSYFGSDLSMAMVENSLLEPSQVTCCFFEENDFSTFHIVLLSQVLEMLEHPDLALELALQRLRAGSYLILHRLRWQRAPARSLQEETYCGYMARNYVWNIEDLLPRLRVFGTVRYLDRWETNATLLFQKRGTLGQASPY